MAIEVLTILGYDLSCDHSGGVKMRKMDRFETFVGLLNASAKSIQRMKARKMRDYGLTSAHTNCICRLEAAGEDGLNQMELVQQEMMDVSQISRVLRELTEKGFVKIDGAAGKYRRRYSLTEQGIAAAQEIREAIYETLNAVSGEIPQAALDDFYKTFTEISESLARVEETFMQEG